MIKYFLLFTIFILSGSTGTAQWIEQVNPSGKKLHGVNFLNSSTGFVCGDTGTVMISTNAGAAWVSLNSGIPASINMTEVQFLNQNTGYCSGGLGSLSGKVYKTTDGTSWQLVFDTTNTGIRDIFFINTNTGWAAGNGGTVKYTSNGGTSWLSRNFNGTTNTCVLALSADTVFVSGFGSGGYIVKSVNAGINWSFVSVPANLADIRFIHFVNSFTGFAGGLAFGGLGSMCKTTDRGLTWIQLAGYIGTTPTDCYFSNTDIGYAVNSTELKLTTDGGISWNNQTIPAGGQFEKIALSSSFGCVAGRKIATNITIGLQQISSEVPMDYLLKQNYPNPFNPATIIEFSIPSAGSRVKLKVFDILGREVTELVNQQVLTGTYRVEWDAKNFPSGVYFYTMTTEHYIESRKMLLIK